MPIWVNMCRLDVNVSSPRSAGDATRRPRSESLPPSQASASERTGAWSLRSVSSMSLDSITTGTGYRSLVTPGLAGLTSVGPGSASSRT